MSLLPSPPRSTLNLTSTAAAFTPPQTTRPAVILPGLGNNTGDYRELALSLEGYGVPSVVAKVERVDWLRNSVGLLGSNYWKGTLRPRPALDWYLERVDEAVAEAKQLSPEGRSISLIGHSAGGWLARVYLEEFRTSNISLLLTLGTPHLPPTKGAGVIDQTRGLLDYVESNCAPAVYTPELRYVCIAGRYIHGARLVGKSNASRQTNIAPESEHENANGHVRSISTLSAAKLRARFVGQGYKLVCGQADVWGDGVVPEVSAHLEGALNISLEGVYHSTVGSDHSTRPWYGSPSVLEKWVHHLLT